MGCVLVLPPAFDRRWRERQGRTRSKWLFLGIPRLFDIVDRMVSRIGPVPSAATDQARRYRLDSQRAIRWAAIRGVRASASLKLLGTAMSRIRRDAIRGVRASASLKPATIVDSSTVLAHPRRTRLGLIEARSGAAERPDFRRHPRRTRLGLIEADIASDRQ